MRPSRFFLPVALALFPPEALAWGLQTHVFFAETALSLLHLSDPALRQAIAAHPMLVLAGACLPDLFLAGRVLGMPAFRRSHRWSVLRRISHAAVHDHERALLVGYATHLVTDVVAHNDFVPEHEARIARVPHATHALAEWAMDEHLKKRASARPSEVLLADGSTIGNFVAKAFRCDPASAGRALRLLARADGCLRASPVPRLCGVLARAFDRSLAERFDRYASRAAAQLGRLDLALAGELTDWVGLDPEGHSGDEGPDRRARQHIARIVKP